MSQPSTPNSNPNSPITQLLSQAGRGDQDAGAEVYRQLYTHLHAMARGVFQAQGGTLQPTVLIHEAWMKLVGSESDYRDRQHFLATASMAMRQVMADHVRGRQRLKRGGDQKRVTLSDAVVDGDQHDLDVADLDAALQELSRLNERHAKVVSLRIFAGMTIKEAGEVLGVSHGTIESDWSMARAWLRRRLSS